MRTVNTLEHEALKAIHILARRGVDITAPEVYDRMDRKPENRSAMRTMLKRIEQKGHIERVGYKKHTHDSGTVCVVSIYRLVT